MINQVFKYLLSHLKLVFLSCSGISIAITCLLTVNYLSTILIHALSNQLQLLGTDIHTLSINSQSSLPKTFWDTMQANSIIEYYSSVDLQEFMINDKVFHHGLITSDYQKINSMVISDGRLLTRWDKPSSCLLGSSIANELNITKAYQQTIKIDGEYYQVVGVLAPSTGDLLIDKDTTIFSIQSTNHTFQIKYGINGSDERLEIYLQTILNKSEYTLTSPEQLASSLNEMLVLTSRVLNAIAIISLIVALTGLASVSYINSLNRINEFGIRKAIGATNDDIIRQLLSENACISLIGITNGIIWSMIIILFLSLLFSLDFLFDWSMVWQVSCVTLVCGTLTGLIPAIQVRKISPAQCFN